MPHARKILLLLAAPLIFLGLVGWLFLPSTPDFSDFAAGPERKEVFLGHFAPLVAKINSGVQDDRRRALKLRDNYDNLGFFDRRFAIKLAQRYRLEDFDTQNSEHWDRLLRRVNTVPTSLVLAQAANESGWGTSRFARQGNNYFGQWCFKAGCGLTPRKRDDGASHEVARFSSPGDSVQAYLHNLNTGDAYQQLRALRAKAHSQGDSVSGVDLAAGLLNYSERGQEYVQDIKSMIRANKLEQYDAVTSL